MKITLCGRNYDVRLVWLSYTNDNVAIQAVDDDGPVAVLTVNTGDVVPATHVVIKDYSENDGALKSLVEAGVVSEPVYYIESGWVTCPVCKILNREGA